MDAVERIKASARATGDSLAQALRHHLSTAVMVRLGDAFVLRGGLATRAWLAGRARRPTRDLDCVGDFPFDVDDTARRFRAALATPRDDGVCIGTPTARGIWLDTAFPGVRLEIPIGVGAVDGAISVDVGFNDPLVPAATELVLDGERVRCVRPETQVAWKLHGLAEMAASWRPKDLADLSLIARHVALVEDDLVPALDAAFASRGFTHAQARDVLEAAHWSTKTSRLRWEPYRAGHPELSQVVAGVRAFLAPALARLSQQRPGYSIHRPP